LAARRTEDGPALTDEASAPAAPLASAPGAHVNGVPGPDLSILAAAAEPASSLAVPSDADPAKLGRNPAAPPAWTEVGVTDPRGLRPIAPPQPTVALQPSDAAAGIGQPIRPDGGLTRAQLRRTGSVSQVQAHQTGTIPRIPNDGVVLTIPWPAVPATEDSDPRRRIPIGAILTGILGELLITAGLILGLYVVWELYWSTVEARPQQAHALEIVHVRPEYVEPVKIEEAAPDLSFAPEYTQNFPEVPKGAPGQPWLSLHVPRWGYNYNVAIAEGTADPVIDVGLIGHYTESQNAGELGNFATAAHRITHGEPYARIQELRAGDELIVETDEYYLVYEMYDQKIVDPTEMSVIWPVPGQAGVAPERRLITLTTCHPRYTSTHRYIVWGELQYWTKKSEGPLKALTPPELRGEAG
jgi:sortase A